MSTMAIPIENNCFYKFKNLGSGTYLQRNFIAAENVDTVILQSAGTTPAKQVWKYTNGVSLSGTVRIRLSCDEGGFLGAQNDNTNISAGNNPTDANNNLIFVELGKTSEGYKYQIKHLDRNLYLTRSENRVGWVAELSGNDSIWIAEEIIVTTIYTGDTVSSSIRKKEYFAKWSGLKNNSTVSKSMTDKLYENCLGTRVSIDAETYNLFGALFASPESSSLLGKFHPGVDFAAAEGTNVASPINGKVVHSSDNYGTVTILNEKEQYRYLFLHMTDRIAVGTEVKKGDVIGKVGGVGAGGQTQFSPHLHIEVHCYLGSNFPFSYQNNSFEYADYLFPIYKILL